MTALDFARAGCSHIAISSRSEDGVTVVAEELKEAAKDAGRSPPQVLTLVVDVASEKDATTAAKSISEAFGGTLDVLVNNASSLETYNHV